MLGVLNELWLVCRMLTNFWRSNYFRHCSKKHCFGNFVAICVYGV